MLYFVRYTDHRPSTSIQQKPSTHKDSAIHWQTNNKANKYYVLTIRTQLHLQLQKIPSNLCWFMVCLLLIPQSKSTIYQRLTFNLPSHFKSVLFISILLLLLSESILSSWRFDLSKTSLPFAHSQKPPQIQISISLSTNHVYLSGPIIKVATYAAEVSGTSSAQSNCATILQWIGKY